MQYFHKTGIIALALWGLGAAAFTQARPKSARDKEAIVESLGKRARKSFVN